MLNHQHSSVLWTVFDHRLYTTSDIENLFRKALDGKAVHVQQSKVILLNVPQPFSLLKTKNNWLLERNKLD